MIRVDLGFDCIFRHLVPWVYKHGIAFDFSRPGKPTDKAFIAALNGHLRSECLNAHRFLNLAEAQEKMEDWIRCCDEVHPRGAIGQRALPALRDRDSAIRPSLGYMPKTLSIGGPKFGLSAIRTDLAQPNR